jgi:long-chain acyl-CoA synthetase
MTNLVDNVSQTVESHGRETAIWYNGRDISYREFWSLVQRFSAALVNRGIESGVRVAMYLPNVPQYIVGFHGILHAGGTVVPMNPQYKAREIEHLIDDSGATIVLTLADLIPNVEAVREETDIEHVISVGGEVERGVAFEKFLADDESEVEMVAREDDDVAVLPYTSGTTGQPKGTQLTHHNLAWDARASEQPMDGGIRSDDKFIGVLPLFHIYGMTITMIAPLLNGGAYYPVPEWNAQKTLSLIKSERLTVMHGVPAMFNDMINQENAAEFDLSSLRFVNSGGSSLPVEVLRQFKDIYDTELYEGYGLTETSPITHANSPESRRPGSIGQPLDGVEAKIVDSSFKERPPVERGPVDEEEVDLDEITGELVIHGPNVMKGYYGLPGANEKVFTKRDGKRWFHTGDIGYHDTEYFFYIIDRKKHMINTAGYNVYPREIEELLFEHPDIADAAVVGIPDERRGETIKAFVVPDQDSELTTEEVRQYCLDNLAEYKHPREVEFTEELPRTTTGKVQKFELDDNNNQ